MVASVGGAVPHTPAQDEKQQPRDSVSQLLPSRESESAENAPATATRWLLGTKKRVGCGDSGTCTQRLRAMRIEKTVGLARPPEEVWTFIADARNDPQWCDKVDSVDQIAGEGPGREARCRVLHRPVRLRKAKELAVTVEGYEPPRQLHFREDDDDATFEVTYRLAETAEGTELTQIDEIVWKIPFPGPQIGRVMVSRDIQRQFAALKRLFEA